MVGKSLPESGEFGIEWGKGDLEAGQRESGECAAHGKGEASQGKTNRSRPHFTVTDMLLFSGPKRPRKRE